MACEPVDEGTPEAGEPCAWDAGCGGRSEMLWGLPQGLLAPVATKGVIVLPVALPVPLGPPVEDAEAADEEPGATPA